MPSPSGSPKPAHGSHLVWGTIGDLDLAGVWGADELRRWCVRHRSASVVSHGGSRPVPDATAAPSA